MNLALSLSVAPAALALIDVPALTAHVRDDAGILAPAEAEALEQSLATYERETGQQIAVLTVPTLAGEAIEAFSMRVAESWKLGRADRDDGILVIVAAGDRRARIEVGYGLEGVIPDALAARIVREQMVPRFRAGAMGEGIRAAVEALMAAGRGEAVPGAFDAAGRGPRGERGGAEGLAHGVMIATLLGTFLGGQFARRRRALAPVASGVLAAIAAWLITVALPATLLAAVAAALLSVFWSGPGTGRGLRRGGPHVFGPGGFGGGWGGGGYGRGGFGGGGLGGGFGGGGGGFGGGGASGSW